MNLILGLHILTYNRLYLTFFSTSTHFKLMIFYYILFQFIASKCAFIAQCGRDVVTWVMLTSPYVGFKKNTIRIKNNNTIC
jgi:hypothetical protein